MPQCHRVGEWTGYVTDRGPISCRQDSKQLQLPLIIIIGLMTIVAVLIILVFIDKLSDKPLNH